MMNEKTVILTIESASPHKVAAVSSDLKFVMLFRLEDSQPTEAMLYEIDYKHFGSPKAEGYIGHERLTLARRDMPAETFAHVAKGAFYAMAPVVATYKAVSHG